MKKRKRDKSENNCEISNKILSAKSSENLVEVDSFCGKSSKNLVEVICLDQVKNSEKEK